MVGYLSDLRRDEGGALFVNFLFCIMGICLIDVVTFDFTIGDILWSDEVQR